MDPILPSADADEVRQAFAAARQRPDRVILEGFHALKHALRFAATVELMVTPDPVAVLALARRLAPDLSPMFGARLTPVQGPLFASLAHPPPATGVVAIARRPIVDAAAIWAAPTGAPLVLLDRPTHLGNLGAVVRVAAAAGAAGVLTTGELDPWHPAALRGSAGLHFALSVGQLGQPAPTARPLIALDPDGRRLAATDLPDDAVLVFGSERHGVGPTWLARAATRLALPMQPGVSSLNLATAAAVVLYQWRLGRQAAAR